MTDILQLFFDGSELIGTIAFAASGAMVAIDRDLDLFGIIFLGIITACGGGIMRDIILGVLPPNAFRNSQFVLLAGITSVLVFLYAYLKGAGYWRQRDLIDRHINLLDALGLGIFSVIGAKAAMDRGYADNTFLCVMMGMSTGVGGGILRDLLIRTIPAVLHKRIYAVASIAGAVLYCVLLQCGLANPLSMLGGMIITFLIRLLATHYLWDLPVIQHNR